MCVCFKTPYLIYIIDPFTRNSWPSVLWFMPKWSLSNMYFLHKVHLWPLVFFIRHTLELTPSYTHGHFNSKINHKKLDRKVWQMWHSAGRTRPLQGCCPVQHWWEDAYPGAQRLLALYVSTRDHKSIIILILWSQINVSRWIHKCRTCE